MPVNERAGSGPNARPQFKQRVPIPVRGMNTVRPPHSLSEDEMYDSVNFWVSPYGRFGSRWGTTKIMPFPLTKEGLMEPNTHVRVSLLSEGQYSLGRRNLQSIVVRVGTTVQTAGTDYSADLTEGVLTFLAGHLPQSGSVVSADLTYERSVLRDRLGYGNGTDLDFFTSFGNIKAETLEVHVAGVLPKSGEWSADLATGKVTFTAPPTETATILASYSYGGVAVTGENLGVGDGTKTAFSLAHAGVDTGTLSIKVAGVQSEDYAVDLATGVVTFNVPPLDKGWVTASYACTCTDAGKVLEKGVLPLAAMDYLPSSDAYILFAGRKVFAIPRRSCWGLRDGWTWGSWELRGTRRVREALPPSEAQPVRYFFSDDGTWFSWDGQTPETFVPVGVPEGLPCSRTLCGGVPVYVGDTNAPTDETPILSALFYARLYVATGGGLQRVYTVTESHLSDEPHYPEDRTVGNIHVETVAARALSNPAPDQAGALAVRVNRLWVSQRGGSRVWFSGVDDPLDWGWDGTGANPAFTGGSFNIDREDGGSLSGLCNFKDRLVCFKFDPNGVRNTIHRVLGTISGADGDYFRREQIAEGISAIDARCVCPAGDDVLFAGAGGIYSLQLVDAMGNVGSVPQSLRVNSLLDDDRPRQMAYSPRRGIAFTVLRSGQVMIFHRGAEAWFRFVFSGFKPNCVACLGDEIFFGGQNGMAYVYDPNTDLDGVESDGTGGSNPTKSFLSRAFDFGQPAYRSFFEKFMLALSVRSSGRVYLDVRTGYGSTHQRSIPFSQEASAPMGWDQEDSQWDSETSGWDRTGVVTMQAKVSKSADNFQLRISSTASVDVLDMIAYGAYLTDLRWNWVGSGR